MKEPKGSKYRGVYRCGNDKWKAQIQIDGVSHYLGIFSSIILYLLIIVTLRSI